MIPTHRVAFVGFTPFERSTLESYFRLAAARDSHAYELCPDLHDSDLVVADAEQPEAVLAVGRAGRMRDAVLIGGPSAPASVGAHLARPIDALQIKRALDAMALRRPPRPSGRARQQAADSTQRVGDFRTSHGFSNSVMVEGELRLDEVLVVSASPAERSVLHDLLSRCGYGVTLARSTEHAIRLCDEQSYGFVFLGLGQDGIDSYQACRRIRRHPTAAGIAPVVVALAHRSGAVDRIRATFAGCDAYLTTPLDEGELVRILAQHDRTFERVFEPTAPIQP
ncbi:response regulator transcription factor [Leptothrix discophora]|uniref:Response regulator n=1 Tax=Leptothrix discophora TaxID=89 RepID=A0ABT9G903_LEPDI|nr:response regulator [Leptothrix discophora]MDP4302880.1 response regulator [Leptothrix discophora]